MSSPSLPFPGSASHSFTRIAYLRASGASQREAECQHSAACLGVIGQERDTTKSKVKKRTMYLYMRLSARNLSSGNFSQVSPTACTKAGVRHAVLVMSLNFAGKNH